MSTSTTDLSLSQAARAPQLLPDLTPDEFADLKSAIRAQGAVLDPVKVDEDGEVIDGRARVRAWNELRTEGVDLPDYPVMVLDGLTEEGKLDYRLALNLARRHLDRERREELIGLLRERGLSCRRIADLMKVSPDTVWRARAVRNRTPTGRVVGQDGKSYPARRGRDGRLRVAPLATRAEAVRALRKVSRRLPDLSRIQDLFNWLTASDPRGLQGQGLGEEARALTEFVERVGEVLETLRPLLGMDVQAALQEGLERRAEAEV